MKTLLVRELLAHSTVKPRAVQADSSLRHVVQELIDDRWTRDIYVVDEHQHLLGSITLRRLARFVFAHSVPNLSSAEMLELVSVRHAGDLVQRKAPRVTLNDHLEHLLDVMFRADINEIPVVDANDKLVGALNMLDLVASWHAGLLGSHGPRHD